ncbi:MAG TPA: hypothetical protein VL689_14550 [Paraburkholderia sp.]|jgi:hypothetical protein|nr:hypothetical protein [Paraburkholderia sp.]
MHYVTLFFCGLLLTNCIPHLVRGVEGKPFPSPFSKPRGVGFSSPLVNVLWGLANLAAALVLLGRQPVSLASGADLAALLVGALLMGVFCARHFGAVQAARSRNDR